MNIFDMQAHWFKNSSFEIFLFPPRIELTFHNLFCSKNINTGCLDSGGVIITEFLSIYKYADANKHTP